MDVPPEQLRALIERLRTDWDFFAPQVLRIRNKAGSIVPFVPNAAQRLLHAEIERMKAETGRVRVLGLKGRQQGFSTYVQGRFYQKVSTGYGKRAFILTHLAEATANLFGMTRRYLDQSPDWLRPSTKQNSASGIEFDTLAGEISVATAGSKGTGRSATAQFFHGSEIAYWPNATDHMAGIGQIVPDMDGTEIVLESTANGVGNPFHTMCMDALGKRSDYRLVFVPWMLQTEYQRTPPPDWAAEGADADYAATHGLTPAQAYWRRMKIASDFAGDEALFDQEYPATIALAFRKVAGDTFIPVALVERARKTFVVDARGAKIMGVDVAEYGTDDTVIMIRQGRDASREYVRLQRKGPMQVVGIVARLADKHGVDTINVDCTGVGSGVADRLLELGYPVQRIHFGERATQENKYPRRAEEMWDEMKAWLQDVPCKLPDCDLLQTEMTMRLYWYDSSRRLVLEPKEKMRDRGLKSPDGGDALALTFATPMRAKKAAAPTAVIRNPGGAGY